MNQASRFLVYVSFTLSMGGALGLLMSGPGFLGYLAQSLGITLLILSMAVLGVALYLEHLHQSSAAETGGDSGSSASS